MTLVKHNWHVITIAVLLLILIMTIITRPSPADAVKEYKLQQKVDSLNIVIQSHEVARAKYLQNIDSLNQSITKLQYSIDSTQIVIDDLKEDYNETLENISNFNTNDISEFFTERYGK
jgi:peptidoglycan hydrolase CwlO-like protein